MRVSSAKAAIIGVCLLLLSGCSMLRLGYEQGPTLAWWWLDGYMDFDTAQAPRVKAALHEWFDWHRRTQLPDYAELLAAAQREVMGPATPQQMCRWAERLRERVDPLLQQAALLAAPIAIDLTARQLDHLQRRYAKADPSPAQDLQPDDAERLPASARRLRDRAEMLYGPLDDQQQRLIADAAAASPFDAQIRFDERVALHQQILQVLREASEDHDAAATLAALRALAFRAQHPAGGYAAYQQQLDAYNCDLASRLHNSTTAAQREFARRRLRDWETDLRALAAARAR